MINYTTAVARIQPPQYACQTQSYKEGHRDALNSAFEVIAPADMEIARLRTLLRRITTAKDIAMPIEMECEIRNVLDGEDNTQMEQLLIEESDLLRGLARGVAARYLSEGHPVCPLACSAMDNEPHAHDCLIGEVLRRTCKCGEWLLGWHENHNDESILPPPEKDECTGHKWKSHKNPGTPDGPAEWFEFCGVCGAEKSDG